MTDLSTLMGGLAFAAIIVGQFAALVAVHGERKRRQSEAFDAARADHCKRLIWEAGS